MKIITNYYSQSRPEIADLVPKNIRTILDIGCGECAFLKLIKELTGAETWGVEMIQKVAEKAKNQADNVFIGKIEDALNTLPWNYFDCITLNDVLEHLYDPYNVLKNLKKLLSNKGIIIASIPNVLHFSLLKRLILNQDWNYTDEGILDFTHIRFFTKKSIMRMFHEAGFELIKIKGIKANNSIKEIFNILTFGFFSDCRYTQFVCIAKPIN